jgi:gamma-glutamyltranspeptidase
MTAFSEQHGGLFRYEDFASYTAKVEARIPAAVQETLRAKGHKLRVSGPWSLGANAAIVVDVPRGIVSAGADARTDAYAWAR